MRSRSWRPHPLGCIPEQVTPAWIVGGSPANPADWPDVVAIDAFGALACTGTLIAPDVVLTAGHCVGGASLVHAAEGDVAVLSGLAHAAWPNTYDVGLLWLASPLSAPPRGLVVDCQADLLVDGLPVTLVGFGAIDAEASEWPSVPYAAETTLRDADCGDLGSGCMPAVSPGGEMVAGGDGVDSCNGDSGGPIFVAGMEGLILAGVTSRAALPATVPCGDGGIYVRTDAVVDWLEENGVAVIHPDCDITVDPPNLAPVVTVPELSVVTGAIVVTRLTVVDDGDEVTATLGTAPTLGVLDIDGQNLIYTAGSTPGEDVIDVVVTDDGSPPMSTTVVVTVQLVPFAPSEVAIQVTPTCDHVGLSAAPWLLLLWIWRRR